MDKEGLAVLSTWIQQVELSEVKVSKRENDLASKLVDEILNQWVEKTYIELGEEWKETGYEGYTISNMGRVRSYWKAGYRGVRTLQTVPRRVLKATPNSTGYRQVVLYSNGRKHEYSVHRLVAQAFLGSCPDGMEVCHCDGNQLNNQLSNLRYDTTLENQRDRWRHRREKERQLSGQTAFSL